MTVGVESGTCRQTTRARLAEAGVVAAVAGVTAAQFREDTELVEPLSRRLSSFVVWAVFGFDERILTVSVGFAATAVPPRAPASAFCDRIQS